VLDLALDGLVDGQAGRAWERLAAFLTAAIGTAIVEWSSEHQRNGTTWVDSTRGPPAASSSMTRTVTRSGGSRGAHVRPDQHAGTNDRQRDHAPDGDGDADLDVSARRT
jgi:hypothetical protein